MRNDAERLLNALEFAAHKHRDQRRKGKDAAPYINHPIQVARLLAECGETDVELLSAAILHDTVEDTETTYDELVETFGRAIADLVDEVTDDRSLPKQARKNAQVEHAAHLSDRAARLKVSDKTNNVRDLVRDPPDGWSRARLAEYIDWAEKVVSQARGRNPELDARFDAAAALGREKLSELPA